MPGRKSPEHWALAEQALHRYGQHVVEADTLSAMTWNPR
jgi:hypothetical protein